MLFARVSHRFPCLDPGLPAPSETPKWCRPPLCAFGPLAPATGRPAGGKSKSQGIRGRGDATQSASRADTNEPGWGWVGDWWPAPEGGDDEAIDGDLIDAAATARHRSPPAVNGVGHAYPTKQLCLCPKQAGNAAAAVGILAPNVADSHLIQYCTAGHGHRTARPAIQIQTLVVDWWWGPGHFPPFPAGRLLRASLAPRAARVRAFLAPRNSARALTVRPVLHAACRRGMGPSRARGRFEILLGRDETPHRSGFAAHWFCCRRGRARRPHRARTDTGVCRVALTSSSHRQSGVRSRRAAALQCMGVSASVAPSSRKTCLRPVQPSGTMHGVRSTGSIRARRRSIG